MHQFRVSSFEFRVSVLRLFLFEEAAETADGVGGILPLRQCLGGPGGGSARASKLRLQHARRKSANIGNKCWVGSRAVDQEGRGCRTRFTAISGALDLTNDAGDTARGSTGAL